MKITTKILTALITTVTVIFETVVFIICAIEVTATVAFALIRSRK